VLGCRGLVRRFMAAKTEDMADAELDLKLSEVTSGGDTTACLSFPDAADAVLIRRLSEGTSRGEKTPFFSFSAGTLADKAGKQSLVWIGENMGDAVSTRLLLRPNRKVLLRSSVGTAQPSCGVR